MTIEQFIIDLLKHHNCVVVPNFGGFIANYQPAIIETISKTITPPSKQVLFNANLIKNDGLLANYVAERKAISYPDSLVEIESKSQEWKQILANEKRLAFGEIGFLYEQDGVIVFEQNRDTNLWLKAYGLSSIQFVAAKETPVAQNQAIHTEATIATAVNPKLGVKKLERQIAPTIALSATENIEVHKEEAIVIPIVSEKKSRKKWGYLAVACAIPFLFYTYWIPMETNFLETGNIQLADFNPFNRTEVFPLYEQSTIVEEIENSEDIETFEETITDLSADVSIYQYQFDESLYIPVKLEPEAKTTEFAEDFSTISVTAKEAPVQLITGCFSIENNAVNFVAELKSIGYAAYVLDKNKGLYRVAVQGFQNIKTAKTVKRDLKSRSYSSWILRK